MQNLEKMESRELRAALEQQLRDANTDARVFCKLGEKFRNRGMALEERRCYEKSLDLLRAAAREDNADLALYIETNLYASFVRPIETEEHYRRCYSDWADDMVRLGRRLRDGNGARSADPSKVGFVLMIGDHYGHTDVLLKYIAAYRAGGEGRVKSVIYALQRCTPEFVDACAKVGVPLVSLLREDPSLAKTGLGTRILKLRERMRGDRIGRAVWVSLPVGAPFAFALGLAPVQIYWALRFHPIAGDYIDGYLTYGAAGETERRFGGQAWRVVPTPLAIEAPRIDPAQARALRARYPERFLFGTVAREEKISSPAFLEAVVAVLRAIPDAGYVWTGKQRDPLIQGHFESNKVAARCHFAGWVDAPLYASAFDAFLETFPLGCGITGYQALGAGTPLLSYLDENTVFGMQYWNRVKRAPAGEAPPDLSDFPLLCGRSPEDYVALAVKLAFDAAFRDGVARRGREFFGKEVALGVPYANMFFRAIEEVAGAGMPAAHGASA